MSDASAALDWQRDGSDWPNRAASRFVLAAGLRWHVQIAGAGPPLLLIHGTGAATHTWRDLLPLLAQRFTVVAPDLPGHGFTAPAPPAQQSLPGMAAALVALLDTLGVRPALAAGHSAGAAILVRMALDGAMAPRAIVSLNGALLPLAGMPGRLFGPLARLVADTSLLPRVVAWRARDRAAVLRLIEGTGSTIDARGVDLYALLLRSRVHTGAVLAMMAHWDLAPIERQLPGLATPLILVAGGNDRTIPPTEAARVQTLLPSARLLTLPGLGHLAHEEAPRQVADLIAAPGQVA